MNLRIALLLLALIPAIRSFGATALVTGQAADIVLGQTDFVSKLNPAMASATSMNNPAGVAIDPASGKVFVADTINNRVLRFDSVAAMTSGAAAEAFFGQASSSGNGAATTPKEMNSPFAVAVDSDGSLWVADSGNNRVLRFDNAALLGPVAINASAVLGQPDLSTKTVLTPPTQASLSGPRGVTVDANGTLWVADFGNNRVLRFDQASSAIDGGNADGVLGAPNFFVNFGGVATQYAFYAPVAVVLDPAGNLWVSDYGNSRVLRFDDAANVSNGALANGVLGQPDFTTTLVLATPTAAGFNHPGGLAIDAKGALWVSDALNSRLLHFADAAHKADYAAADVVLGQADFVTKGSAVTATGMSAVFGLAIDPASGALWAADTLNHRVLHYLPQTVAIPQPAVAETIALTLAGKRKLTTAKTKLTLKGTAAGNAGVARVEYRVGKKGGFHPARGTTAWSLKAKLPPGRSTITIRAVSPKGVTSPITTVRIFRQ